MAASASAVPAMPAVGDIIVIKPHDERGELVLVIEKKRKTGAFKGYLMGVRAKDKWPDLVRRFGKSVSLLFVKEETVPDPVVGERDATVFCKNCKILGNGTEFDLDALEWLPHVDLDVLVDKAKEVLDDANKASDDEVKVVQDTVEESKPKAKAKAKAATVKSPFYLSCKLAV